jgi:DNA-directed RNA polymerase subunit RPC12/RpoP
MAYKCLECGHIFEEGECASWYEHHPYGMGTASEEFSGCPLCKGDYEETKQCKICGGEFLEDELLNGNVCRDCLKNYKNDFEMCYKVAKQSNYENVKINPLIANSFDEEFINAILYVAIKTFDLKVNCESFIKQDEDWFSEGLVEEVSK